MAVNIAVVGSLNMDLVVQAPRIPNPGETIIGGNFHTVHGGKGANQAEAAARLGAKVSMIGRVGKDAFGDSLLEALTSAGINKSFVIQDPKVATGVALIMVDDEGENSIVVASGANMCLTPSNVEAAEDLISVADVLLLQLENPLETIIRAAELADIHSVKVILNPAPAQFLPIRLIQLCDVLVPNEIEVTQLGYAGPKDLLDAGIGAVIVTCGADGADLYVPNRRILHQDAFPVEVIDSTGAGDAFTGALAVALGEGRSIEIAVQWAAGAGALATRKIGARTGFANRNELIEFLETNGTGRQWE